MLPRCEPSSQPHRILVVEDEVLVRLVLAEEFRAGGFSVVEAAGADEALSYLRSGAPIDLVLTDMHMPGSLDGLGLAELVRRNYPRVAVVLTSGTALPRNLAGVPFVPKPYDVEQIVAMVHEWLATPDGKDE